MTRKEYEAYEKAVAAFMAANHYERLETEVSDDDGSIASAGFSWGACHCCKRPEGGDRYIARGVTTRGGRLVASAATSLVCPDCVYYAEYGRLDDTTMMGIEDS